MRTNTRFTEIENKPANKTTELQRRLVEAHDKIDAIASHLKLVIEPGYAGTYGSVLCHANVRQACKECGK